MTKEQDLRAQNILFRYERLIEKAILNKEKAKNISRKEYEKWDKMEKEYKKDALDFLNRYSKMFNR